jgi:hypothetical protein
MGVIDHAKFGATRSSPSEILRQSQICPEGIGSRRKGAPRTALCEKIYAWDTSKDTSYRIGNLP